MDIFFVNATLYIEMREGRLAHAEMAQLLKASLTNKKAMNPELTDSASPACQFAMRSYLQNWFQIIYSLNLPLSSLPTSLSLSVLPGLHVTD